MLEVPQLLRFELQLISGARKAHVKVPPSVMKVSLTCPWGGVPPAVPLFSSHALLPLSPFVYSLSALLIFASAASSIVPGTYSTLINNEYIEEEKCWK